MALVLMDCVVQDNNFAREAFRRLYLTERFVLFDLHRCSLQIDGEMSMKKVLGYFRLKSLNQKRYYNVNTSRGLLQIYSR
jgi:hypothetical protein